MYLINYFKYAYLFVSLKKKYSHYFLIWFINRFIKIKKVLFLSKTQTQISWNVSLNAEI